MSLPLPPRLNAALRDHTGRYRLAVEHLILDAARRNDLARLDALSDYVATPLGQYRPLPQALRYHKSGARFRWCLGGNRSSKSHALAVETVWLATGLHPFRRIERPTYGWYSTTTWDEVGKTLYQEKLKHLLVGIEHEVIWHNKQRDIVGDATTSPKLSVIATRIPTF